MVASERKQTPPPDYPPLTVLPVADDPTRFYCLGEEHDGEATWYECHCHDESRPGSYACECPQFTYRLWRRSGWDRLCKHAEAVRQFIADRAAGVERISGPRRTQGRPNPQDVCGTCPMCGDAMVMITEYHAGAGYVMRWQCWQSLGPLPLCHYRRAL